MNGQPVATGGARRMIKTYKRYDKISYIFLLHIVYTIYIYKIYKAHNIVRVFFYFQKTRTCEFSCDRKILLYVLLSP